jgi:uncharacterized protein YkwD
MRRAPRTAALLLLVGLATHAAGPPDLTRAQAQVMERANQFRRAQGRTDLTGNAQLAAAARGFAAYMARTDRYGHEADGRAPAQRAAAQGYAYCLVAENIAYVYNSAGFSSARLAEQLQGGWERSPGHRRNLLDADATELGVAIAQSPRSGRYYGVQLIGRPATMSVRFQVDNRSNRPLRYELGGRGYTVPPRAVMRHEQCRQETLVLKSAGRTVARVEPADGKVYRVVGAGTRLQRLQP